MNGAIRQMKIVFARNLWSLKIFPMTPKTNYAKLYTFLKNKAVDDSHVSFIEFRSTITNYKQYFNGESITHTIDL